MPSYNTLQLESRARYEPSLCWPPAHSHSALQFQPADLNERRFKQLSAEPKLTQKAHPLAASPAQVYFASPMGRSTATTPMSGRNMGNISKQPTACTDNTSGDYVCHHDDCRRRFVRKTSLTNHLKAHKNVKSRSIYRTKRARLRAAAAAELKSLRGDWTEQRANLARRLDFGKNDTAGFVGIQDSGSNPKLHEFRSEEALSIVDTPEELEYPCGSGSGTSPQISSDFSSGTGGLQESIYSEGDEGLSQGIPSPSPHPFTSTTDNHLATSSIPAKSLSLTHWDDTVTHIGTQPSSSPESNSPNAIEDPEPLELSLDLDVVPWGYTGSEPPSAENGRGALEYLGAPPAGMDESEYLQEVTTGGSGSAQTTLDTESSEVCWGGCETTFLCP